MPTQKNDAELRAQKIALDVSSRRRAGEEISDEQILREHPDLQIPLKEQLTRLRLLETARRQVEREETEAVPADAEKALSDGTLYVPPLPVAEAQESQNKTDELRLTLKEQIADTNARTTMVVADSNAGCLSESVPQIPLYRPTVRAPMAVVKLIHDGQQSYNQYPVLADRFRIGRMDGDLTVPHDFWMSGRHAEIQRRKSGSAYRWFLVDLHSTNGTFVRTDFATLKHNDEIFLGQERYRFSLQNELASLMHVTTGSGQQWALSGATAVIGRLLPCGLRSFSTDPFLNPVHAMLKRESSGNWTIKDNSSCNGVWYRVKDVEMPPNCQFQLGEQRFSFWYIPDQPVSAADLQVASRDS